MLTPFNCHWKDVPAEAVNVRVEPGQSVVTPPVLEIVGINSVTVNKVEVEVHPEMIVVTE